MDSGWSEELLCKKRKISPRPHASLRVLCLSSLKRILGGDSEVKTDFFGGTEEREGEDKESQALKERSRLLQRQRETQSFPQTNPTIPLYIPELKYEIPILRGKIWAICVCRHHVHGLATYTCTFLSFKLTFRGFHSTVLLVGFSCLGKSPAVRVIARGS